MTESRLARTLARRKKPIRPLSLVVFIPAVIGVLALGAAVVFHYRLPKPATLRIESEPSGAAVYLNSEYRGTTPMELGRIHPGQHLVRLTRHHYQPWQEEVRLDEGVNQVTASMRYREGGKLSVTSEPSGATVYVDGDPKGVTPTVVSDVDPGGHPVRLVLPDYLEWESTPMVRTGITTTVQAELMSRMESFLIRATEASPDDVTNWTELFHYYVVTHNYEKAPHALAHAMDTFLRKPGINQDPGRRLYTTINRIWSGKREIDYGSAKEIEKARQAISQGYEEALKLQPDKPELYAILLDLYADTGGVTKANDLLKRGLAKFPYDDWYMSSPLLGRRARRGERAVDQYRKQLEGHPNDLVSRMRLVKTLDDSGLLDDAIAEYPKLIEKIEHSEARFTLFQRLASLYERRRRPDDAQKTYEKALAEKGAPKQRANVLYRLMRLKRDAGEAEAAIGYWERAIAVQPDVEYACRWRFLLAQMCVEHDQPAKARRLCEEILELAKAKGVRKQASTLLAELPKS